MRSRPVVPRLIEYNRLLIEQGAALIESFAAAGAQIYRDSVGTHLRHVLEHYEAFLRGLDGAVVDYEARPRDVAVESSLALAAERFRHLGATMPQWPVHESTPLTVLLSCGLEGEETLLSQSSVARELQFLASHTVHHYALIAPRLQARGHALPPDFGKAPGTVRHERRQAQG